jgi:hypothetical protein
LKFSRPNIEAATAASKRMEDWVAIIPYPNILLSLIWIYLLQFANAAVS